MPQPSRRMFLTLTTAAAASPWLLRSPSAGAADVQASVDHYGGFRVGIQSNILHAFSPELEPTIEHIADLDLPWAEFLPGQYPVTTDEQQVGRVRTMLADHGVATEAYFLHDIEADADAINRGFAFAELNDVAVLVGQPVPEALPQLNELVRRTGIKLAIHNYGPGHRYDRVEDALTAIAPYDWRIGCCLDTGHCMRSGEDPVESVRRIGTRLHGMHLRDHVSIGRDEPDEAIVGEGAMDLPGLCQALREVNFTGPLSLEIYYNPQQPLEPIRQSLHNFAEAARATL